MFNNGRDKAPVVKKMSLGFLITTILMVCINNSIITLRAVYYYSAVYPWYEWLNYLFLGIFLGICPILCLFFLDSIHVRRGLRFFLFGMALNNVLEVFEGSIGNASTILTFERPLNPIYLMIEFIACLICWLFLLRQVRGISWLPIPIRTDRRGAFSGVKNLRDFILNRHPRKQKLINIVLLINCICFAGIFITLTQENREIVLQRPEDHKMQINFWNGGAYEFTDEALQYLSDRNVTMYGWCSETDAQRYCDFNVSIYRVYDLPTRGSAADNAAAFAYIDGWLDWADADPKRQQYFKGFVADYEGLETIANYSEKTYEYMKQNVSYGISYINDRGYEYAITQTMANIGDRYDGDPDMDIVYDDICDPGSIENITVLNWMIYRSESAMIYDEPFEYFTYQWAVHISRYMEFLETEYGYEDGFWTNKSAMSLGVTKPKMYTYNTDLRDNVTAFEEIVQEVKICHACGISEVAIWKGTGIIEQWGLDGLKTLFQELDTYESVTFRYKRRATFFGNLKWVSNVAGSVFGLYYSDGLYEAWYGYLGLAWMLSLPLIPILLAFKRMPRVTSELLGKRGTNRGDQPGSNEIYSKVVRALYFALIGLILIWTFIIAEIFIFSKEVVQWAPWYFESVALGEEWFQEFWTEFKSKYVYLALGGMFLMAGLWILGRYLIDKMIGARKERMDDFKDRT